MADNTDIRLTVEAWADIVIKRWEANMQRLGVKNDGALANSFAQTVQNNAGGDMARIEFAFNYYGKFVDMGVGRGTTIAELGNSRRKAKKWYGRTFYAEVKKLGELLADKYAHKAQLAIVETMNN